MENSLRAVESFEVEQMNNFSCSVSVLELKNICNLLKLEFVIGIAKLEDFSNKELLKRKLIHAGYLFFEVTNDGKAIRICDEFDSLGWSTEITSIKTNGQCELVGWTEDEELHRGIRKSVAFLANV